MIAQSAITCSKLTCSSVSIINFEQVNADWVSLGLKKPYLYQKSIHFKPMFSSSSSQILFNISVLKKPFRPAASLKRGSKAGVWILCDVMWCVWNIAKFLRTVLFIEHIRWLFLNVHIFFPLKTPETKWYKSK